MRRLKPLFRWAGGKARLARTIRGYLPREIVGAYCEPFVGAGAVLAELLSEGVKPSRVLVVDAVPGVREVWRAAAGPAPVAVLRENIAAVLVWARHDPDSVRAAIGRASSFLAHQYLAYGGLYRVNSRGRLNVPFDGARVLAAAGDPIEVADKLARPVADLAAVLAGLVAVLDDDVGAFESMARGGKLRGATIYCDPPYSGGGHTAYAAAGWRDADLARLEYAARVAAEQGSYVALSNADVPVVREIFANPIWRIGELVTGQPLRHGQRRELIITSSNYEHARSVRE